MPRTHEDVRRYLEDHHLPGEVITFSHPTRTVEEAARAVGVEPARILKTLLFMVKGGEPVLVLAAGTTRVDYKALARFLGLSRKKVRLASPEEVLRWTGYPVGAVPPLALARPLRVLMDEALLAFPEVYAGGGSTTALLRIPLETLKQATGAQVVPLARRQASP